MKKLLAVVVAALLASPAFAQVAQYNLILAAEGNDSPGTGTGMVFFDPDLSEMRVQAEFSGLVGDVTVSHIHCCTSEPFTGDAGVATPTPTFPGFPSGETFGSYDMTFDMTDESSYNAAFITANGGTVESALSVLLEGFDSGRAYLNVHTSEFGGGEIRGFLQLIPEPSSALLALAGMTVLGAVRWRSAR